VIPNIPPESIGPIAEFLKTFVNRIADFIGASLEPKRIIKKAKAQAEADKIKASSELQIKAMQRRAKERITHEEAIFQSNLESIYQKSLPLISIKNDSEKLTDDWLMYFFNKAKFVSDEDMKILWSKILAGEANHHGSFSKNTLNIVEVLSKEDAQLFTNICKFNFYIGTKPTIFIRDLPKPIFDKYGINFTSLKYLSHFDLFEYDDSAGFSKLNLPRQFAIQYFNKTIYLEMTSEKDNILIYGDIFLLKSGVELTRICGATYDEEIMNYTIERLTQDGIKVIKIIDNQDEFST
jgi:hypothetical protein